MFRDGDFSVGISRFAIVYGNTRKGDLLVFEDRVETFPPRRCGEAMLMPCRTNGSNYSPFEKTMSGGWLPPSLATIFDTPLLLSPLGRL